jgi:hypothetical protein
MGDTAASGGNYQLARELYERARSLCDSVLHLMNERTEVFSERDRSGGADLMSVVESRISFCRLAIEATLVRERMH